MKKVIPGTAKQARDDGDVSIGECALPAAAQAALTVARKIAPGFIIPEDSRAFDAFCHSNPRANSAYSKNRNNDSKSVEAPLPNNAMNQTEPLHNFRLVDTQSAEEFSHKLSTTFGVRKFDFPSGSRGFSSTKNRADLDSLALFYCRHRSQWSVEIPETDVFHYVLCRAGQTEVLSEQRNVLLTSGGSLIANPNAPLGLRFGGNLEHFVLKVRGPALRKKLQALADTRSTDDIRFDSTNAASTPEIQSLNRAIFYLVNELDAGAALTSLAVRELEQLVVTLLLQAGHHNFSELLESGRVSPSPGRSGSPKNTSKTIGSSQSRSKRWPRSRAQARAASSSAFGATAVIPRWHSSGRRG